MLKDIRKQKGLTQRQLEELSGVDQGTISRYEKGTSRPSFDNALRLGGALGVDPRELFPVNAA